MGALGKLFGGSQPKIEKIDPTPQQVAGSNEVEADTTGNQRRKRGFASTIASQQGASGSGGRTLLG